MTDDHELNVASQLAAAKQLIEKRDRQLALASENNSDLLSRLLSRSDAEQLKTAKEALNNIAFQLGFQSFDNKKVEIAIESLLAAKASNEAKVEERDRQIEELQASLRNHHEQFDDLKSNTEVAYKAIAMMLESLKGDRKPDETKEVDGVMVTFRNYDDNLTHHHKTIIIGNIQRAIANESSK